MSCFNPSVRYMTKHKQNKKYQSRHILTCELKSLLLLGCDDPQDLPFFMVRLNIQSIQLDKGKVFSVTGKVSFV